MKLLDTHVLIWRGDNDRRLGAQTRDLVDYSLPIGDAAVSVISFWEIAMRVQKGHLRLPMDLYTWRSELAAAGLVELPISGDIAARAGLLANMHGDPADRLIIATALEGHELVTADRRILDWPGPLSRLDARR